jgi:aryl-phospho-beta-D-glucosidase BglC (GH1 family)
MKFKTMKPLNQKKIVFIFIGLILSTIISAQITPHEAIKQMQKGINLGNTHEPPTEGGWNNPKAQEYYFDLYKDAGFDCVRIPVRYDNYTGKTPPYKVSDAWLNRIEEVAEWGLKRGLFIVINTHHDDWIKSSYTEANKVRFDSIWSQIAVRFKDKTEKLIFEIINEPHGLTKAQNDDLHARVLSIIRKTNPTRLVIFQGHNWGGSDELLTAAIPKDNFLIGSFHSYDPYLFGLQGQGTWGSASDYNQLENKFKAVSNWSVKNNIPVFLGEFGSLKKCEFNSRMRHYRAYVELSQKYGFASMAWDDGGDFRIMERQQKTWDEVKDILIYTNLKSPVPSIKIVHDSIVNVSWMNRTTDHDSIIIQQRVGSLQSYKKIATLKSDATSFDDIKPSMNKTYTYRVIAHYNDTTGLYSQPVQIFFPTWVKPVRIPFHGAPHAIPGSIEAEDFDKGGEDFTYHDADGSNIPGKYRPDEGVDIYDRLGTGFHVGNAIAGEWYEYSVDVKSEGLYTVTSHLATVYRGGKFQISIDSVKSEIITVTSTLSNLNTKPFSTEMYLYPGKRIMRFTVVANPLFNIDKFEFDLKTANSDFEINPEKPFYLTQTANEIIVTQNSNQNLNHIGLYSVTGSLIKVIKNPGNQTVIPIVGLPAGVYIIQSSTASKRFSEKVVINPL